MRKIKYLFLIFFFVSCSNLNKVVYDKIVEKNILIDECNRAAFNIEEFENWFYEEYSNYKPDENTLRPIKQELFNYDVLIVMATWSKDSRREVPRFYKILDHLAYHEPKIRLINVDPKNRSNVIDTKKIDIKRIPTFIIYKDGVEIGRIIESPKESLDKDLVKIIRKNLD